MNIKTYFKFLFLLNIGLVTMLLSGCAAPVTMPAEEVKDTDTWGKFEAELESLRQEMKIPGMSAAVVKDGELVWARGFGYSDVENGIPAAPETPYHLASVTKTFAAVIVMQLVQEGKLSLEDPVSRYGVNLPEGDKVLVRHLMNHTSEGTPGQHYQYNGNRYGQLSLVVQAATGRSLQELVYERIIQPLGMENTAPSPPTACTGLEFAPTCDRVYAALTQLYFLDTDFNPIPGFNQDNFNAGAGLISTVVDLAKFDAALDANILVTEATKELMWTPTVSNSGQTLPYGLGWFTQDYRGMRLIWHTGFSPPSTSTLFLKLPDDGLTFIVLANTDMLSRNFQAGHGDAADVLDSLVALAFYKQFVLAPSYSQVEDESVRDFLSKEFEARGALASSMADLKAANERLASMLAMAEEVAGSLESQTLDLYAGTYELPEAGGLILNVTQAENKLYVIAPDQTSQELLPLSTTRFFIPFGYDFYQLDFAPDATNDQTYHLVLTLYGMSFKGRRK